MVAIELLGPSGIGKTTFLKTLQKARGNADWITSHEALASIYPQKRRYYQVERLVSRIARVFGFSLQKRKNDELVELIKKYEADCALMFEMFLTALNASEIEVWQKIKTLEFNIRKVLYRRALLHNHFKDSIILLDEGIVQNWARSVKLALENPRKYQELTKSVLFPKAVMYFELDDWEFRKRLSTRFNTYGKRKINLLLEDVTDEEIERYIVRTKQSSRKTLEACKCLNLPVLELQPVANEENIDKALNFIQNVGETSGAV